MKRTISLLMTLAMAVVLSMTFTSCDSDDDADTAYFFEGYWEGQMGSYFYDELGYGTGYYYSQLDIVRTNTYGGRGQERDYNGRYSYQAMNFTWTVQNGYIYFRYDNGAEVMLDFSVTGSYDGTDRMLARVYNPATGEAVGSADLYRLNYWYDTWYDDPYWAKPNKTWNNEEEK